MVQKRYLVMTFRLHKGACIGINIPKLYFDIPKLYFEIPQLYFEIPQLYFEIPKLYFEISINPLQSRV